METTINTQPVRWHRSGLARGLGVAIGLSMTVTAAQLVDAARGHHLTSGDIWGQLVLAIPLTLLVVAVWAALRHASAGVAAVGVVVLAVLAWLSMILWWAVLPAYLGIAAASVAGLLSSDDQPPPGPARIAGIVGLFAVGANAILVIGALLLTVF
jgi:hypothetical protein